jgi:hypothetical protein
LFDKNTWVGDDIQSAMINSTMENYIFWSVHVSATGDLSLNDTLMVSNGQPVTAVTDRLKNFIALARNNGSTKSVWFSIGSADVSDYQGVENILDNGTPAEIEVLYASFQQLMDLGADGFDFDYEENLSDPAALISKFAIGLNQNTGAQITFCPYYHGFWIDALIAVYKGLGSQPVVGYNLQWEYGG